VTLAALGGIIGIVLGLTAGVLANNAFNVPYVFNPGIILIAFLFSAAVGVIFGYFPARRAAQLDPIETLRHELGVRAGAPFLTFPRLRGGRHRQSSYL